MKKRVLVFILSTILAAGTLSGCGTKVPEESTSETAAVETSTAKETEESSSAVESKSSKGSGEEELQIGKGVNGDIPSPDYTYEGIVNGPVGLYPYPYQRASYSVQQYVNMVEEWKKNMQSEVDKIEKPLTENATDTEIDHFFNQLLYIAESDYSAIEEINRFSYVIFKNDMQDPFTNQSVVENKQVNVEIVLDASGSMAKQIDGETMMNIAKNSISEVLKQLPANANVGLRVFGHLGDNTDAGKAQSCAANELIFPIEPLNAEGINAALAPIKPTGWTSIADSIKKGVEDLSQFKDENTTNILYIITDGIETCGGDPTAAAKELKNNGTNIVFGIIGFNVNATQDALLREIAQAGEGYYANASDAGTLTSELYNISEAANTVYNWEPLTRTICNNRLTAHNNGLLYNKFAFTNTSGFEHTGLYYAIDYAKGKGIIPENGDIYKKLREEADNRRETIKQVMEEEYHIREAQSKEYLASIEARIGEEVAVVFSTSRVNPFSDYYTGPAGEGGSIEDSKKDGEQLNSEQEESMKNE